MVRMVRCNFRILDFMIVCGAVILAMILMSSSAVAESIVVHGRITASATGAPISGAKVSYPADWFSGEAYVYTNEGGDYSLEIEVDPAADCPCFVGVRSYEYATTKKQFDAQQNDVEINFSLQKWAKVSGTVRRADSGLPESGVLVEALQFVDGHWENQFGNWDSIRSEVDGSYELWEMTPGVPYRICAGDLTDQLVRQCFDHVDVAAAADIDSASPFVFDESEERAGIDFDLSKGGSIEGVIRDARTGRILPEFQIGISLYDQNGEWIGGLLWRTDSKGAYRVRGVPNGTFYLAVHAYGQGFDSRRLFPGIDCPQSACDFTQGQPITLANGGLVSDIDFSFLPTSVVRGVVTDHNTGAPLGGIRVVACEIYYATYRCVAEASTSYADGSYEFYLRDKKQLIIAYAPDAYVDQIFPDRPCDTSMCSSDQRESLHPQVGDEIENVNFALRRSGRISGVVVDALTNAPLRNAWIEIYREDYSYTWVRTRTDDSGHFITNKWLAGTSYLAAYTWMYGIKGCAFYSDRPCPADMYDPAAVAAVEPTAVVVPVDGTAEGIAIRLEFPDLIFDDGFEAAAR